MCVCQLCMGMDVLVHYLICVWNTVDFGMAQHLTLNELAESFRGSPLYMVGNTSERYLHVQNMLSYVHDLLW